MRIIQEKGARNQVLTLQGRLSGLPLIDNRVNPVDLLERIEAFFGANPVGVKIKSQLYEGSEGKGNEHYLHLERDSKKLVVKYLD